MATQNNSTELNKEFFQTVIRSYEKDDLAEVIDFKIIVDSLEDQHFASSMSRATIKYKTNLVKSVEKSISVYVKSMPSDHMALKLMENIPMFDTEMRMYGETLYDMQQLLESFGVNLQFGPELIYQSSTSNPVIVIKDAGIEGFVCQTIPFYDVEEVKKIFERLAKFHAASFYLVENEYKDFSNYNATVYESTQTLEVFFYKSFRALLSVLESWKGFENFIPKINYLIDNLPEIGRKLYTPNKRGHGYNVLNHGDFHLRNMLFKFDVDRKVQDILFIDFQICVWASPAIDLFQTLSCTTPEIMNVHGDEFIAHYHQEFVKTLTSFGYLKKPPTLVDVHVEMMKHGELCAIFNLAFAPLMFMDPSKMSPEDMITGMDSFDFKKKVLQTEDCEKYMKTKLKEFEYKGWL